MPRIILLASHLANIRGYAEEDDDVVFSRVLVGVQAAQGEEATAVVKLLCQSTKNWGEGGKWEVLPGCLMTVQSQSCSGDAPC